MCSIGIHCRWRPYGLKFTAFVNVDDIDGVDSKALRHDIHNPYSGFRPGRMFIHITSYLM